MTYEVLQTCLLVPDLTSTQCASWVQAWGSIAAILVAVWIADKATRTSQKLAAKQADEAKKSYERARVERHLEQIGPVLELFDAAVAEMDYVRSMANTLHSRNEWAIDDAALLELDTISEALRQVPVHGMPTAKIAGALVSGRVRLSEALQQLHVLIRATEIASLPTAEQNALLDERLRLVNQQREEIRASLTRLIEKT